MPIFEYKCIRCGRISEFLEPPLLSCKARRGGSKGLKVCPHCGSRKLEKQISTFALGVKEGNSKSREGCLIASCEACDDQNCPHFYPP